MRHPHGRRVLPNESCPTSPEDAESDPEFLAGEILPEQSESLREQEGAGHALDQAERDECLDARRHRTQERGQSEGRETEPENSTSSVAVGRGGLPG